MSFTVPSTLASHAAPSGGTLDDADYGDVTVSGGGTVLTVDSGAVDYSELSGVPSTFAPAGHHANHEAGGSDKIKLDDLDAPDDTTDLDASTTKHGLLKKLDNSAAHFLDGQGNWSTPAGTGATASDTAFARRGSIYLPFTVGTDDDEFDDQSFSGSWTQVNSGSHLPTITEDNDVVSMLSPGSDAAAEMHAFMKARTLVNGSFVECWVSYNGKNSTTASFGVVMANGAAYAAGAQVAFWMNGNTATNLGFGNFTNYNTQGTTTTTNVKIMGVSTGIGLRLVYLTGNNWAGYLSTDGISWANMTGTLSRTLTPTHAGFWFSSWGSASDHIFSFRYCRFN